MCHFPPFSNSIRRGKNSKHFALKIYGTLQGRVSRLFDPYQSFETARKEIMNFLSLCPIQFPCILSKGKIHSNWSLQFSHCSWDRFVHHVTVKLVLVSKQWRCKVGRFWKIVLSHKKSHNFARLYAISNVFYCVMISK